MPPKKLNVIVDGSAEGLAEQIKRARPDLQRLLQDSPLGILQSYERFELLDDPAVAVWETETHKLDSRKRCDFPLEFHLDAGRRGITPPLSLVFIGSAAARAGAG